MWVDSIERMALGAQTYMVVHVSVASEAINGVTRFSSNLQRVPG